MTTLLTASLPLTWLVPLAGLLGLLFGSFFNVVIYRLPKMLEARWQAEAAAWHGESPAPAPPFTLAFPASHCPHCAHRLAWWENLPVLSWLLLRGRCHACHAAISPRYPMVELTSAGLAAGLAAYFGWGWPLLGAALLTGYLLVLAWIDADTQLLPDCLTLPLLWLGLVFNLLSGQVSLEAALWVPSAATACFGWSMRCLSSCAAKMDWAAAMPSCWRHSARGWVWRHCLG